MKLIGMNNSLKNSIITIIIILLVLTVVGVIIAKIFWDRNAE